MRILHVLAEMTNDGNGLALFVQSLAEAQAIQGDTVNIFTNAGLYDPENPLSHNANPFYYNKDFASGLDKYAREADIIHIHGCWTYPILAAARTAKRNSVPYVHSPHGAFAPVQLAYSAWKKALVKPLQQTLCKHASFIHAASELEAKWASNYLNGKPPRISVIPCGIERPQDNLTKSAIGQTSNLLYLGRLHPLKGVDILLKAFAVSGAQDEGATLTICGRNERGMLNELKKQASELAIENSVKFISPVSHDKRWELLSKCDALILPSQSENFGMTVGEALALGKIAIATKNSYWQMLDAKEIGFTVEPTVDDISKALVKLIALPSSERQAMGQRAIAYIKENLTWGKTASELHTEYLNAIARYKNG